MLARPRLRCRHAASLAATALLAGLALPATGGPAAGADAVTIDSCRYPDDAAAQALWQPMGGSPPAQVVADAGGNVLRLRCRFAGTDIPRASWDRSGTFDLSAGRAIRLRLHCADPAPVTHFNLYFQSGDGWYTTTFFPEKEGWNTIRIEKPSMDTEGQPGGWDNVRTIRVSAWRGAPADTEFLLGGLELAGLLGDETLVVVVRADSVAASRPDEHASVSRYSAAVVRMLDEAGVGCAVASDLGLGADALRGARLVVLPYNPSLPDGSLDTLVRYMESGGRLLACYGMPERLRPLAGIEGGPFVRPPAAGGFATMATDPALLPGAPPVVGQNSWNIIEPKPVDGRSRVAARWLDARGTPTGHNAVVASANAIEVSHVLLDDDPANKRRLLVAMAGRLVPDVWRQAASSALARAGKVGPYPDFAAASEGIAREAAGDPTALGHLAEARRLQEAAATACESGQFAQACDHAAASGARLLDAFCAAQRPTHGEFRGFWCHNAFGVQGMDWEAAIARLAENGFTAILPNMLWGGVAYYPSEILPVAPEVAARGDPVAACLAACRKHGMQVHVWKVNWNLGRTPEDFLDRLRQEGRLQADSNGKESPWLCPSHPENQRLEIESMVEVARRYAVDGIHFDYIRYPDANHCFCAGCRARFGQATGVAVADWPEGGTRPGPLRQKWLEWRRSHITAVVKAVSEQARAARPGLQVSAAVFRNWPGDRDSVAQDWKDWCDRGFLDFVCPMDYTANDGQFAHWTRQQLAGSGKVPCYPGIGAWVLSPDRVIGQIRLARQAGARGFTLFNYDVTAANELVPRLGLGATRKEK